MLPQPFLNQPENALSRLLAPRGFVACLLLSASVGLQTTDAAAQPAAVVTVSQAEARRQAEVMNKAAGEIERGQILIEQKKAEEALAVFTATYESLPDIPMAQQHRSVAREGYVTAGCLHAQALAARGDMAAANRLLDQLLDPKVAPDDTRVLALKRRFADPDRFPPALTAQHVANVEAVQALLIKASSFLELGDPDKAIATYQDVLRIDPYNTAARRGMEAAELFKQRYYNAARDHQRSKMLSQVDQTWEDPLPLTQDMSALFGAANVAANKNDQSGRERIVQKLRTLVFPQVEFSGVTLDEVVELLRVRSRDLDPEGRGVSFIVNVDEAARGKSISLNLQNVPLEELLRYITENVGIGYKVEEHAVILVSLSERNSAIVSRSFRVPPDFIQSAPVGDAAAAPGNDPFANTQAPAGGLVVRRMGAKEFLEARGVTFPEGTSASFNSATSTLTVRNTQQNMDAVELLVEQASKSAPKLAVIQVRMLEVNQTNLEELGFDWLLEGVSVNSDNIFVGGGAAGNGTTPLAANFPFQTPYTLPAQSAVNPTTGLPFIAFPAVPVNGALAGPLPGAGTTAPFPYGGGPVTAGLRSGGYAVGGNSIDNLLRTGSANGSRNVAPGVLSVAGVFTDPQFQGVLRGLSQKKGVDINASPSVTTKNGLKATVEITREIIYPTEFDPPQLPQNSNRLVISFGASQQMIATPTTPTAFETRKTGVLVDVEPVISDDGRTVELTISPELTDFEGFVNYGSPIYSPASQSVLPIQLGAATAFLGAGTTNYVPLSQPEQLITPNLILQPIFKTQKVVTSVKIWDGATVMLGGAKVQQRTLVNDKVPLLGDLPFVGRFFQSDVNQTDTKNVIIFVTVNVVDPSGRKVNQDTAAAR